MDPSSDEPSKGPYTSTVAGPPRLTPDGRPSIEARPPNTPPRLQKKRSNAGVRAVSQPQSKAYAIDAPGEATNARGVQKARKGSLRNAVRKLFGRRSREVEAPQASQVSPPRHGYHRSEPHPVLAPQPEVAEDGARENTYAYRTFSAPTAPLELVPSAAVQRTRSPYAVEFPRSARLKPLNLGDPYTAPGSQLRRRKTLPSILAIGSEEAQSSPGPASPAVPPAPNDDENEIGRALSTDIKREKRRSRSAGDLRVSQDVPVPARNRSDEIRFWRESIQGTVLRASGFTVPVRDDEYETQEYKDDEHTPMPGKTDPFETRASPLPIGSSPPRGANLDLPTSDFASPSALGSQLSQDLEDRIARLEAGLRSFRGELAQMAADRNRRTVLIGGVPAPSLRRRASSGGRTASMLAETLQTDFGPSNYEYDYTSTARPSTSPQPPRTPPARYKDPASGRALAAGERPARATNDDPFITATPSPPRQRPTVITSSAPRPQEALFSNPPSQQLYQQSRQQDPPQQPQQHTFRSLYEMLADERSARRRLEMQMRGLREEIANLHYQVSNVSNIQSQRSSYYGGGGGPTPAAGPGADQASARDRDTTLGSSSRLHALLRETEASSGARSLPPTRDGLPSNRFRDESGISIDPRVVSRFSGSESEAGVGGAHDDDERESTELVTPAEAYMTPLSGEGDFPFRTTRGGGGGEGRMF